MPSQTTPPPTPTTKYLSSALLAAALRASKPIILSDAPPTTTRGRAPLPSSGRVNSIAWSPLGTLLAVADPKCLRVWNPDKPSLRYSTELRPASTTTAAPAPAVGVRGRPPPAPTNQSLIGTEKIAWRPNREAELASVGSDGVVRFWDVRARGTCVGEVDIQGSGYGLVWRPDGEEVVVTRKDDTLITISRTTLTTTSHTPLPHPTGSMTFTPDGSTLILTTADATVKILDYPSLTPLTTLTPHTSSITCSAHSPSGRHLAFGGSDALLTLWSTHDLICRHSFAGLSGPLRSVSFSWDGSFVVGGVAADETVTSGLPSLGSAGGGAAPEGTGIKVFACESGEEIVELPTGATASLVEWHPSRYVVAWGGEPGGVRVLGMGTQGL